MNLDFFNTGLVTVTHLAASSSALKTIPGVSRGGRTIGCRALSFGYIRTRGTPARSNFLSSSAMAGLSCCRYTAAAVAADQLGQADGAKPTGQGAHRRAASMLMARAARSALGFEHSERRDDA